MATGAAIYVQIRGAEDASWGTYTLLWVVAAAFWLIYLRLVWMLHKYIQGYDLVLPNGIMIQTGGYDVTLEDFEKELDRIYLLWTPYFIGAPELLREDRIWVRFEGEIIRVPFTRRPALKYAGITVAGGEFVRLTYFNDPDLPLRKTAFAHELGHVILGRATKRWNNNEHHKFMKVNLLP